VYAYPNLAHRNEKQLKPRLRKNGYLYVSLRKDGKTIDSMVHRLVAKSFLDCVDGLQVNHINGKRADNRLVNLEMVTPSHNYLHGMFVNKNGIAKRAAEYPNITDWLDGMVKGDQAQIDKYIADCLAVKARFPKS
jgi:hypothetical protein